MSYYVYMLKSKTVKPVTYVGYTKDLKKRIKQHNTGKGAKFTKGRKWEYIYIRTYNRKVLTMKDEYKLKKDYKLRNIIKLNYLNK